MANEPWRVLSALWNNVPMRLLGSAVLIAVAACCCGGSGDDDDDTNGADAAASINDLAFCVQETNRLRALDGKSALSHSQALEDFATDGARADHQDERAHGHFIDTNGGGIAFAENECPGYLGWRVMGDVRNTIGECLQAFYDEGPGGGHYDNLMGDYGSVGCGVYVEGTSITIVQDLGR